MSKSNKIQKLFNLHVNDIKSNEDVIIDRVYGTIGDHVSNTTLDEICQVSQFRAHVNETVYDVMREVIYSDQT